MCSARPGRDLALLLEHVGERLALEQLHREVQRAIGSRPTSYDRDAVGMIDSCRPPAPRARTGCARRATRRATGCRILTATCRRSPTCVGAIHEAHAAATERRVEAIAAVDDHADQLVAVAVDRHRRGRQRRIGAVAWAPSVRHHCAIDPRRRPTNPLSFLAITSAHPALARPRRGSCRFPLRQRPGSSAGRAAD